MYTVVYILALAGCLAPATPQGVEAPAHDVRFADDAEACLEVFLGVLVDPAHARRFLPEGVEPADAGSVLPVPVATGRALVSVNAVTCEAAALGGGAMGFADVIVPVERPSVRGADVPDAARHAYLVHYFTSETAFLDAVDATGFSASRADVRVEAGAGAAATGVVADDEGALVRIEVAPAPAGADTATANQYQATPGGVAVHALGWSGAPLDAGAVTACAIREGSLVADVLGTTDCRGVEAVGFVMGPADRTARFGHHAGAAFRGGDGP